MTDARQLRERQRRLRSKPPRATRRPRSRLPGLEGVGGIPVVVRSLDLSSSPQTMTVQLVQYTDSPPVVGNLEAIGDPLPAYPFPSWSYEMYNIKNLVRPVTDGEVFGLNAHICLLMPDGTLLIPTKPIANMTDTDPNAETS